MRASLALLRRSRGTLENQRDKHAIGSAVGQRIFYSPFSARNKRPVLVSLRFHSGLSLT
jgi:hypothetical protein